MRPGRLLVSVICSVAVLSTPGCGRRASHPLCVAMEDAVKAAEGALHERAAVFRSAIAELDALRAAPAAGACPVGSPTFTQEIVFSRSALGTALPPSLGALAQADATVALFRDTCGVADTVSQERVVAEIHAAIDAVPSQNDLVVVEVSRRSPVPTGSTFVPGELQAVGLVYSHAQQRFVCRADVSVSNREEVTVTNLGRDIDYLERDLNRQAIEAARRSLQALP